jgi:hypothetical protein
LVRENRVGSAGRRGVGRLTMGFQRQKVCDLHGKDVRNVCQPENPAATIPRSL